MTAILLSLLVAAVWWMTRPPKNYTTTQWREAMRRERVGNKVTVAELRKQLEEVTGIDYLEPEPCKDCGFLPEDHAKGGICPRDPSPYERAY